MSFGPGYNIATSLVLLAWATLFIKA